MALPAVVDSKALISELVKFYATPPSYRQDSTLSALASRLEVSQATLMGHLSMVPGAANQILQAVALSAAEGAPEIMQVMKQKALAGDVRAAQTYLDFFRMTITDQQLIEASQARVPVGRLLEEVASSAGKLLQLAQNLGGDEITARVGLRASPEGLELSASVSLGEVRPEPLDLGRMRPTEVPYPPALASGAVLEEPIEE